MSNINGEKRYCVIFIENETVLLLLLTLIEVCLILVYQFTGQLFISVLMCLLSLISMNPFFQLSPIIEYYCNDKSREPSLFVMIKVCRYVFRRNKLDNAEE